MRTIPETKTPPNRRHETAMAYDSLSNVLILYGGFEDTNGYYDDLWKFDLNTNTWEEILSPSPIAPGPRSNSYMKVLPGSRSILLFGGVTSKGPICDLWKLDMENYVVRYKQWQPITPEGTVPPSSSFSSKTTYEIDGKEYLVIYGGVYRDGNANRLYILDLHTLTWTKLESKGKFPTDFNSSTMKYYNGYLYNYGGWDYYKRKPRDLYRYDISTGIWSIIDVIGEKPPALVGHRSFVYKGYLHLIMGTKSAEIKNLDCIWRISLLNEKPSWEQVTIQNLHPSIPRSNPAYVFYESKLYVFGGYTLTGLRNDVLIMNLSKMYTAKPTFEWEILSKDMTVPISRLGHAMTIHNDKLYLIGGKGKNNKNLSDIWKFDLKTEVWESYPILSKKPLARSNFAHVKMNDLIAVYGGEGDEGLLDDMQILNLRYNTWEEVQINSVAKPAARKGACISAVGNTWVIFGGKTSAGYSNEVWRFDYTTGEYEEIEVTGMKPPGLAYSQCKSYVTEDNNIILDVSFGETWGITAQSCVYKFELSDRSWTKIRDNAYDAVSRSRAVVVMQDDKILAIGGHELGMIAHDEIYELNLPNNTFKQIGFIPERMFASGFLHYGDKIYIHGGGKSFFRVANHMNPTNTLIEVTLNSNCNTEILEFCSWKCSKGTFYDGVRCVACPSGSYNELIGALECKECEAGYFSDTEGAESRMECEPCKEESYNPYPGQHICLDCPASKTCSVGSISPQTFESSSVVSLSYQPELFEGNYSDVEYRMMNIAFSGLSIVFLVLVVVIGLKRTRSKIKSIDIYTQQHNYKLDSPMYMKKTTIGGISTAVCITLMILVIINACMRFIEDNISESKTLVPSLALESKYDKFIAKEMVFEYTFKNYGGECTINDKCTDDLEIIGDDLEGNLDDPKCHRVNKDCNIQIKCHECELTTVGSLLLVLSEERSYASDILVNITTSSSVPDEFSSFFTLKNNRNDEIFRGQDPTVFYYEFIPSLFLSEVSDWEAEGTGYHVSSMNEPKRGSSIKTNE